MRARDYPLRIVQCKVFGVGAVKMRVDLLGSIGVAGLELFEQFFGLAFELFEVGIRAERARFVAGLTRLPLRCGP